jgi:RNA polymerase sigma factor (TIGR02999 family)
MPLVYEELRRLARGAMRGEGPGHVLQTTAIVHEAYVRLVDAEIAFNDRVHFYSVAVRMMRRIPVDHARAARAEKRGGGAAVTLSEDLAVREIPIWDYLDLDRALDKLAEQDPRKAKAIELSYFAGLKSEEIGVALGVAPATVRGDLRLARAWLLRELA